MPEGIYELYEGVDIGPGFEVVFTYMCSCGMAAKECGHWWTEKDKADLER